MDKCDLHCLWISLFLLSLSSLTALVYSLSYPLPHPCPVPPQNQRQRTGEGTVGWGQSAVGTERPGEGARMGGRTRALSPVKQNVDMPQTASQRLAVSMLECSRWELIPGGFLEEELLSPGKDSELCSGLAGEHWSPRHPAAEPLLGRITGGPTWQLTGGCPAGHPAGSAGLL